MNSDIYHRALGAAVTGVARFALVILALEADSRGLVILDGAELARRLGVDIRIARKAIKELGESGDLTWKRGGGRGRPSIYGILTGLAPEDAAELAELVQNSDHRSVIEDENGDQGSSFHNRNSDHRSVIRPINGDHRSVISTPHESTLHDHDLDHEGFGNFEEPNNPELRDLGSPSATPAPAPDRVIKDPNQFHPACQLYKQITGYRPNKTQAQAIAQGYDHNGTQRPPVTDLDRWRQTLERWRLTYANSFNAAGMLDWYHEPGRMERTTAPPADRRPNNAAYRRNTAPSDPARAAELARRVAALNAAAEGETLSSPHARTAT